MATVMTCNACNVTFSDEAAQKVHYRCDWHRYNLKRKVAGLPGVTDAWFEKRREALAAEATTAERLLYTCTLCGKQYSSEQGYKQHVLTKQHLKKAAAVPEGSADHQAKVRPAPARAPAENGAQTGKETEKDEPENDGDSDWEEVDEDEELEEGEDLAGTNERRNERRGEESTSMEEDGPEWDPTHCLFCGRDHKGDVEACVAHMHSAHGFFIPDVEYVKDLTGMLQYLGFKVSVAHMCLLCDTSGRHFTSMEAARKHMIDKSHCKLPYEDGPDEELADFYDFSSSYSDADHMQLVSANGAEPGIALSETGNELIITGASGEPGSSKIIGSREFARYYKQRHRPNERREVALVNQVVGRYRALGLATKQPHWSANTDQGVKHARRLEQQRTRVMMKANVNNNLPRNVPY